MPEAGKDNTKAPSNTGNERKEKKVFDNKYTNNPDIISITQEEIRKLLKPLAPNTTSLEPKTPRRSILKP